MLKYSASDQPPIRWRITKTVIAVVAINVKVAEIDRLDRRAMPQTPWPDVQPEPKVTPSPTIKPPIKSIGIEAGTLISGISPRKKKCAAGPVIMPNIKAARQEKSLRLAGAKTPVKMPVAPITRPKVSINRTAERPIKIPPVAERSGVNSVSILRPYVCA